MEIPHLGGEIPEDHIQIYDMVRNLDWLWRAQAIWDKIGVIEGLRIVDRQLSHLENSPYRGRVIALLGANPKETLKKINPADLSKSLIGLISAA